MQANLKMVTKRHIEVKVDKNNTQFLKQSYIYIGIIYYTNGKQ
jgi:hypothetical protein